MVDISRNHVVEAPSFAGSYCRNRELEWMNAAQLMGIAAALLITPETLEDGVFRYLLAFGLTPVTFGIFTAGTAVIRIVGLYLNGNKLHPMGPRLRFAAAVLGFCVWSLMAVSLSYLTTVTGTISIGIPIFVGLAGGEIYTCLRVGRDRNEPPPD